MSRFHCFLALFPFWLLSLGCVPRPENEVVIYAAADREFATPILDGFERGKEKISITRQFDIESSKTLGLVLRIEAESAKPSCDCFWNNEIIRSLQLHHEACQGVTEKSVTPFSLAKSSSNKAFSGKKEISTTCLLHPIRVSSALYPIKPGTALTTRSKG